MPICIFSNITVIPDLHKMQEWDELIHDEHAKYEWVDSEESGSEGMEDEGSSESEEDEDEDEEAMEES